MGLKAILLGVETFLFLIDLPWTSTPIEKLQSDCDSLVKKTLQIRYF